MANGNSLKFDAKHLFGKQVARYRRNAGLTQDVVAEKCGIFRTYLSRIEHGNANPSIGVMDALAATLGIPLYKLLLNDDGS